jgi:hypothetical protein
LITFHSSPCGEAEAGILNVDVTTAVFPYAFSGGLRSYRMYDVDIDSASGVSRLTIGVNQQTDSGRHVAG